MSKITFRLNDGDEYTDNRFGAIIKDMLQHSYRDCIITFRNHVCVITYNKKIQKYFLEFAEIDDNNGITDYYFIKADTIIKTEHECHKWVPYLLMSNFRKIYPELKDINFPVTDYIIWFSEDATCNIFVDEDKYPDYEG